MYASWLGVVIASLALLIGKLLRGHCRRPCWAQTTR